jgi:hypothetical protein
MPRHTVAGQFYEFDRGRPNQEIGPLISWDFNSPGNRRYPHYHPGGDHATYGHIFYGERGYRVGESKR